jgi:Domain of unknown function (DUF5655)
MTTTRDWSHNREMWIQVLKKQTGKDLNYWNARIEKKKFADAERLKKWLIGQDVTGYAEQLLVMEHFGYPDFLTSSADELIDRQYADRSHLRPIYEAIVASAQALGEVVIQARKGFVSLLTSKRTFARVQATTKNRIDLGQVRGIAAARPAQTFSHSRDDVASSQPYGAEGPGSGGLEVDSRGIRGKPVRRHGDRLTFLGTKP